MSAVAYEISEIPNLNRTKLNTVVESTSLEIQKFLKLLLISATIKILDMRSGFLNSMGPTLNTSSFLYLFLHFRQLAFTFGHGVFCVRTLRVSVSDQRY